LLLQGDVSQARELFRVALDNAIFLASPLWTYEVLYNIAQYLQEKHDLIGAVQLLAACDILATRLKLSLADVQGMADNWSKNVAAPVFDAQWEAGKSLSTAEAIALAQQALEKTGD